MEPMPQKYIIGFSQVDHAQSLDAIGLLAQRLHKLVAHSIPIPLGFAITSHAFDDFLIANSLVEFISTRINNTDYANHAEIKRNAGEIQEAIEQGHMPDIIKEPILKAYSGLGYNDPLVILKQSPVDAALAEELVTPEPALVYAKGEQNLLDQIKNRWALLFSVEAMFYRAESGYEGDLSDAIVVQRTVQAESSGLLYTVDMVNKYSDIIEIQAILGQYETILKHELVPDSYYVNKKTEEIVQKKIVEQDWMLIKRGRDMSDLDQRITLSAIWSKQQKLDDTSMLKLARLATQIERIFSHAQQIVWAAEAGRIFILDTKQLDFEAELKESSVAKTQDSQVKPESPQDKQDSPKNAPEVKRRESSKKDIDAYVREIQASDEQRAKNENVEIELQPLDSLSKLLQGEQEVGKLSFGLCHFIKSEADWEKLTGDEILIVEEFNPDRLALYEAARGVIFLHTLSAEQKKLLNTTFLVIPDDTSDLLQEGMVVTLDPLTGRVLMGAGEEQIRTQSTPEKTAKHASSDPVPMAEVSKTAKKGLMEIQEREQDVEVDTSTGIWEVFAPSVGKLGKYTKGAYLKMEEVYRALGYEQSAVADNRKTKIAFLDDAVGYLSQLLTKLGKRNLLLTLSSERMAAAGLLLENEKADKDSDYRLLRIELELVAVLRNREGQRNLWICFSDVTSPQQLATLKSEVNNAGCRRSATFRIFANLEREVSYINIRELCEVGLDGFVLDLPSLSTHLYPGEAPTITDSLISFVGFVVSQINKSKAASVALISEQLMSEKLVKTLVENALSDLVMVPTLLNRTLPKVASWEVKKLKTVKRGRKKKQIDYGF